MSRFSFLFARHGRALTGGMTQGDGVGGSFFYENAPRGRGWGFIFGAAFAAFFYCDYRQRFALFSCDRQLLWSFLQELFFSNFKALG